MLIELKVMQGNKFVHLPVKDIVGMSVINYMMLAKEDVVAALKEGDNLVAIISNRPEWVEKYKDKTTTFHAKDLYELLQVNPVPDCIAKVFPDSDLFQVEALKEN